MESKKKYWTLSIQNGKLNDILEDVEAFLSQDNGKVAEKLLSLVSSNVSKHNEYPGSCIDINNFVSVCCGAISQTNISDELNYLRCLHHLIKHLIQKGETELAFDITNWMFLINENSATNSETLMNTYYATYFLLRDTLGENEISKLNVATLFHRGKVCMKILTCAGPKYLSVLLDTALKIDKLAEKYGLNQYTDEKLGFLVNALKTSTNCIKCVSMELNYTLLLQKYQQLVLTIFKKDVQHYYSSYWSDVLKTVKDFVAVSKIGNTEKLCFLVICELTSKIQSSNKNDNSALKEYIQMIAKKPAEKWDHLIIFTNSSISFIFSKLSIIWSDWVAQDWKNMWSHSMQCEFYYLVSQLLSVLSDAMNLKTELMNKEKNFVDSICTLHSYTTKLVYQMLHLSFNSAPESFKETLPTVVTILDNSVKFLARLKDFGPENWIQLLEQMVSCCYNIGAILVNHAYYSQCQAPMLNLFKACLKLGFPTERLIMSSAMCYVRCALKQGAIREALKVCAVCLVRFPDHWDTIFHHWVNLKCASSKSVETMAHNLFNILIEEEDILKKEFPGINLKSSDVRALLVAELKSYNTFGVRLWPAIESAALTLNALYPDSILSTEGIEVYLKAAWKRGDTEISTQALTVGREKISLLTKMEKKTCGTEKVRLLGLLGDMCFDVYILELKILQKNQMEIFESQKQPNEDMNREQQGEAADISNSVFTEHLSVSIDKERELMEMLNKALHAWVQLLEHIHFVTPELQHVFKSTLDNIETASYMYGLNGCTINQVYTWALYYRLAKCLGMDSAKFHAKSSLLKISSFLQETELTQFMDLNKEDCDTSQLCFYWVCRSYHCLQNESLVEGFNLLLQVKERLCKLPPSEVELLQIEVNYLSSVYLSVPNWNIPASYKSADCISDGVAAFKSITEYMKKKRQDLKIHARLMCMLMDVAHWLISIHFSLYWTIDVYHILRELLIITQIAGLSTRAAYILTVMAESDVLRFSFSNAKHKLVNIDSFFVSSMWAEHYLVDSALKCTISFEDELQKKMKSLSICSSQLAENVIDFHLGQEVKSDIIASSRNIKTSTLKEPSSPVCENHFERKLSVQPPSTHCTCYSCVNLLSHVVLLYYMTVMALFNNFSNKPLKTLEYLEEGLSMCSSLYKLQKNVVEEMNMAVFFITEEECVSNIPSSLLVEKIKAFVYHYARFLSQHKKHDLAEALNQRVTMFEENVKVLASFCSLDLIEHQYALKLLSLGSDPNLDTTVYKLCAVSYPEISPVKTPECSRSVMQITPVLKQRPKKADTEFCYNMRRRCNNKAKIIFDMDDKIDDIDNEKSTEQEWKNELKEYGTVLNVEKSRRKPPSRSKKIAQKKKFFM